MRFRYASALLLLAACHRATPRPATETAPARLSPPAPAPVVLPTRLLSLPISAYTPSLALDGDDVYLLTDHAAYRLRAGAPSQKIELELGHGSVLAESGIVFWSKGAIWNAAKHGGSVWRLTTTRTQPEYLVTSGEHIAWLDRVEQGPYRIQTIQAGKARVLLTSENELSAVHMIGEWVFYVQRGRDGAWRIGRVPIAGGEPSYTDSRTGPTPSQLTGRDSVVYYDMDKSEIRQLTTDLKAEHVWLKDFVCSPIFEARHVFCGRVEGLFQVLADSRSPRPLTFGRHATITLVRANTKQVVWLADTGADQLAVEMLPIE